MAHDLETRTVPIGDLTHYRKNPRRGDIEAIKESLRANGQYRPIVARRQTLEVLAGNHTLPSTGRRSGRPARAAST
jgi:ParB-like nuclease domain